MDENNSILIDRYLSNQLTSEEHIQFENRMHNDASFRAEVELHINVLAGIDDFGKNAMRAEIAAAVALAKAGGALNAYKPAKNGGGNWFWNILQWLIVAGIVGTGVYIYTHPQKQQEIMQPVQSEIEQVKSSTKKRIKNPTIIRRDTVIRMETIYHVIKTKVNSRGESESTITNGLIETENKK